MKIRTVYIVLGLWIAIGTVLGFAAPQTGFGGGMLQTRQILFFHVPMAFAMEMAFLLSAIYGVLWLWRRNPRHDALSVGFAETGAYFGIIATVVGAVFARHNWGMYWDWDPQETGIVVALFTYAALFSLRAAVEDEDKQRNLWSVYAVLGCITAFGSTVVLRRVLPDDSSLHPQNAAFDSDRLYEFTLWFNIVGYMAMLVVVANLRARLEIARERIKQLVWSDLD